jgi:hypothetical protein
VGNFQWLVKKMLTGFAEKPLNFLPPAIAFCTKIRYNILGGKFRKRQLSAFLHHPPPLPAAGKFFAFFLGGGRFLACANGPRGVQYRYSSIANA